MLSPTFILIRGYEIVQNINYENFYHLDLYPLEENVEEAIKNSGFLEIIKNPKNIIVIE